MDIEYQKKILSECIHPALTHQSQCILNSNEWLLNQAKGIELDYSFAVVGYFKILEIELFERIFIPFKNHVSQSKTDLLIDEKHITHGKLLNGYLYDNERISFGESLNILSTLEKIKIGNNQTINLYNLKLFCRSYFPKSYFLYGKKRLADKIYSLSINIRNPAVHSKNVSYSEFSSLRNELIGRVGKEGLIATFLKATSKS